VVSRVDEQLRREVSEFSLKFTCERCLHFDEQQAACSHGYPTEPHRSVDLGSATELCFCKEFDLL
jgi:hypothetical protein